MVVRAHATTHFFCWKLHGSTKFVVRAVALLSAKRSEKESSKMIMDSTSSAYCKTTKTGRNTGQTAGKEEDSLTEGVKINSKGENLLVPSDQGT